MFHNFFYVLTFYIRKLTFTATTILHKRELTIINMRTENQQWDISISPCFTCKQNIYIHCFNIYFKSLSKTIYKKSRNDASEANSYHGQGTTWPFSSCILYFTNQILKCKLTQIVCINPHTNTTHIQGIMLQFRFTRTSY